MNTDNTPQPIDFAEIAKKIWAKRMLYLKVLPAVLVGTYLFTLFFPRYYTCQMQLAPESNGPSASGSVASLASSFGLGNLAKMAGNNDAISSLIYPDLLKSPNFIVTLFPVEVTTKKKDVHTTYYEYMKTKQDAPFWDKYIIGPIQEWIKPTPPSNYKGKGEIEVRNLSKLDQDIVAAIGGKIQCAVDKKTDVVTITVTDQDPEVCATIGDAVVAKIQRFIIDYRTKKAINDYRYYAALRDNAKTRYEQARQQYATMSDANTDVTLQGVKSKIEDLENDMQLRYNTYSALATQAQAAQGKIQENTPAFTALATAIVPQKPAGPKRTLIALAVTLLAAFGMSAYIGLKK